MDSLLQRAAGDAIAIELTRAADLWTTLVDPNQLENVLLNLVINARDAMAGAGKVTIGLDNHTVEHAAAALDPELTPGEYVLIAVTDTGEGMPPEVIERAFEPFFTTKPEGKGTGLGLSMAHGFVRQSGGHIRIDSVRARDDGQHLFAAGDSRGRAAASRLGARRAGRRSGRARRKPTEVRSAPRPCSLASYMAASAWRNRPSASARAIGIHGLAQAGRDVQI